MSAPKEIAGYRVLQRIGEGAASVLYAVQEQKTKQVWALKYVEKHTDKDQRFIDQVQNEHAVGSKLNHPNVRGVSKFVRHRERFKVVAASLVLELVDAAGLDAQPRPSMLRAVEIFLQVAEGLLHMHQRGFVHADLKPNNLLANENGQVKIIDLGQGCKIGTIKKRIQGTPGYMAPEQAHRQEITPQTDVYNFGATLYWVLCRDVIPTALPPKDDGNLYSGALDADMVAAPTPPHERNPDVHPLISKLVLDCVELDPNKRPTMADVHKRLELIKEVLEAPEGEVVLDNEETQF